jgi:hypothetical protein
MNVEKKLSDFKAPDPKSQVAMPDCKSQINDLESQESILIEQLKNLQAQKNFLKM